MFNRTPEFAQPHRDVRRWVAVLSVTALLAGPATLASAQVEDSLEVAVLEVSVEPGVSGEGVPIRSGTTSVLYQDEYGNSVFDYEDIANPIRKTSFLGDCTEPPTERDYPFAAIGGTQIDYEYKLGYCPNPPVQPEPSVAFSWAIDGTSLSGTGTENGWNGTFAIDIPPGVGKYSLAVTLEANGHTETLAHTLYVVWGKPVKDGAWTEIPLTSWLDTATAWAAGETTATGVLGALNDTIYENPFGWRYGADDSPETLIENGGEGGVCGQFRAAWHLLAAILGVEAFEINYAPADLYVFLTSTRPALDGNESANAFNAETGIHDRWVFDSHKVGRYLGAFYDPTFGLTGPYDITDHEADLEGNVLCEVTKDEVPVNGVYTCETLTTPPDLWYIWRTGESPDYAWKWWAYAHNDFDDGDEVSIWTDNCKLVANPDQADSDSDLVGNDCDNCPDIANPVSPVNGAQPDSDRDGAGDVCDGCVDDALKVQPGQCGCGFPDTDGDADGTADCNDECAADPDKVEPGQCGCGVADDDPDGDAIAACHDNCPAVANPDQADWNGDRIGDACDGDRYLFYDIKQTKGAAKFSKLPVEVANDFGAGTFIVRHPVRFANPASTDGEPIIDAVTSLTSFRIKPAPGQSSSLAVSGTSIINQFHDTPLLLDLKKPDRLLVPGHMGLLAAPADPPSLPVDNYACYPAKVAAGEKFPKGLEVRIDDRFTESKVFELKRPTRLCIPTETSAGGLTVEIQHPDDSLMCYALKAVKGEPRHDKVKGFYVADQFGMHQYDTKRQAELCVPSEIPGD